MSGSPKRARTRRDPAHRPAGAVRPGALAVGVDTGGTFTDFVALRGGRLVAL